MKSELKISGCLEITPETELESYALSRWSDDFFQSVDVLSSTGKTKSTLLILAYNQDTNIRNIHDIKINIDGIEPQLEKVMLSIISKLNSKEK